MKKLFKGQTQESRREIMKFFLASVFIKRKIISLIIFSRLKNEKAKYAVLGKRGKFFYKLTLYRKFLFLWIPVKRKYFPPDKIDPVVFMQLSDWAKIYNIIN